MAASNPSRSRLIVKRAFDIVASVVVLVVLSPLLAFVSLAIKVESSGPVFSVENQYWHNSRVISVLRFRCTKRRSITMVGRALILTGIETLPMLINVLLGDMSIVGLRRRSAPPSVPVAQPLSISLRESAFKQGLISLGELHDESDSELRGIEADQFYISNWSLLLDVKIIFRTIVSKASYVQHNDDVRLRS
jgi:lipopolysaccharide/colanic/teichoic acid biosynthesis glycosyltransferase